jgi:hypothetical protein
LLYLIVAAIMKRALSILLVLLVAGSALFFWFRSRDKALSERPVAEQQEIQIPPARESLAVAKVMLSYAAMSEALNEVKELQSFDQGARDNLRMSKHMSMDVPGPTLRNPLRMVRKDWDVVLFSHDVDYTINVRRTSGFVFSPNGKGVRVSVPINFSGQVGFPGDVEKVLQINKKSFDGQVEAYLDVSFDVDETWNPTLEIKPGFDWKNRAEIEIVGGVWIHVAKYLNDPLNKALDKAADALRSRISAEDLKREIAKVWKAQAIPLEQNRKTWGYCNIRPTGAFFSGVTAQPEHLVFDIGVSANAQFSERPDPRTPESLPLPPLQRGASQGNKVHLVVPIEAGFKTIRNVAVDRLRQSSFTGQTPLGQATLTIHDAEIYAQKDRIVVGLKFEAKFAKSIFNERGWVYLTTKPTLDVEKQEVSLEEIRFTRIIDNHLWKLVSVLFEGTIKDTIKAKARRSLRGDISELISSLQASASKPETTPGVRISAQPTVVGLRGVSVAADAISVVTEVESPLSVEIYSAALLKK